MTIEYRALKGEEIRLLTICAVDEHSNDDRIHCTLDHFSLSESKRKAGSTVLAGKINFKGEVKEEGPEYYTVLTDVNIDAMSSVRTVGHIEKSLARMSTGRASSKTPSSHPERFTFSLRGRHLSQLYWDPPRYGPDTLPDHSPTRYSWGDFVALSYMWGSENAGEIVINGKAHAVTTNLEAALREIRGKGWFQKPEDGVMLWVDALCINQNDEVEKDAQVMRMGQIYREAGNILVWLKEDEPYGQLGEMDITSDLAIQYMQWLSKYYRTEVLEAVDHSSNAIQVHEFREVAAAKLKHSLRMVVEGIIADNIDIDDLAWFAIFHFVSNPYWRRLWIIQELAMGQAGMPILCRGRVTQWRYIRDSALIIAQVSSLIADRVQRFAKEHSFNAPELTDLPIDHIAAIAELAIHGQRKQIPYIRRELLAFSLRPGPEATPLLRGTRLLQILALASHANCFKPEDRVWGLLEVPRIRTLAMKKTRDQQLQDVYIDFATRCIDSGDRPTELESASDDDVMTRTESQDVSQHGIPVSLSTTYQAIYRGVTYSFDIFAYVNGFETALRLPSWVPDLSALPELRVHPMLGPWTAGGRSQSVHQPIAKFGPPLVSTEKHQLVSLEIKAVLIDEVISISAIQQQLAKRLSFTAYQDFTVVVGADQLVLTRADDFPEDWYSKGTFHQGLVQDIASPKDLAKDEETARYSLAKVLVAGSDRNGNTAIDLENLFEAIPALMDGTEDDGSINYRLADFVTSSSEFRVSGKPLKSYFNNNPIIASSEQEHPLNLSHLKLRQSMAAKVWGRRLAITTVNGALCLVPMATQPGDLIWVIPGHRRPVVLRKMIEFSPSTDIYRLIGEVFMDGIMEGEVQDLGLLQRYGSVILL